MLLIIIGLMPLVGYILYHAIKAAIRDGINESNLCKRNDIEP